MKPQEYTILKMLKEKPMLMTELQKELGFTTNEIVGVMAFLEKYQLVKTSVSNDHELMAKITQSGLQLLDLPSLPGGESSSNQLEMLKIDEKEHGHDTYLFTKTKAEGRAGKDKTIDLYTSDQQVESIKGIAGMATRFGIRNSDVIHATWAIAKDSVWAKLEQDVKERSK